MSRRRKRSELALLVQNLDVYEIAELAHERLDMLFKLRQVALDLRPQQRFHAVARELRLQFVHGSGRIAEELRECRAYTCFRPRAFNQNAVENFDLK